MNKNDPDVNGASLDTPRLNDISTLFDRIRGRLLGIHKTDVICIALAVLALAISVPFYAFNRSAENIASLHCQAFFRCLPESVAAGSAEMISQLKKTHLKFLDEGLPSGIWCFSWSLFMLVIWKSDKHFFEKWLWCSFPALANLFWELFQKIDIIPGSASSADCVFGILGAIFAYVTYVFILNYRKVALCSGKDF